MHILAGQPGGGKTTLAVKMAAIISSGSCWPDKARAPAGRVIIWSGEDDPADTLVPRLEASGADLSRVLFIQGVAEGEEHRAFDPSKDIGPLKQAIETVGGCGLVIVDPIVSATSGDSHKNSETRKSLQPLVDMAAELGAGILGIHHFTKGSEGSHPIDRITGSVAFGAVARIVMVAAKGKDGEEGKPGARIFMRAKSNIGPDDGGFNYDLQLIPMREHPDIEASVAVFGEPIQYLRKRKRKPLTMRS
jgi:putative DNA primase/helicase